MRSRSDVRGVSENSAFRALKLRPDIGGDPRRRYEGRRQQSAGDEEADHGGDARCTPELADGLQICAVIHGSYSAVLSP